MKRLLSVVALLVSTSWIASADEPPGIPRKVDVPSEDVVAHDPVIVKEGSDYYLFTTGPGVSVWRSTDRETWTMQSPVFPEIPAWTKECVPAFNGHMWAPDISLRGGRYYLFYSVSAFGKNTSCIGVATNTTLDRASEEFAWVDHGVVVQSEPGEDDWNAIDPNLVFDRDGTPYLAFGSFWSGLKIAQLTPDLLRLANPNEEPLAIASRKTKTTRQVDGTVSYGPGNTAIEGGFVYPRDGFFYLFASVDYCCRGADSTYKMVYGRSKDLLGPYLDKDDIPMLEGGGTLLMEGNDRWHGVGHNAVCPIDGDELLVFHGYDAETKRGLPKLRVETLGWDENGWPYVK